MAIDNLPPYKKGNFERGEFKWTVFTAENWKGDGKKETCLMLKTNINSAKYSIDINRENKTVTLLYDSPWVCQYLNFADEAHILEETLVEAALLAVEEHYRTTGNSYDGGRIYHHWRKGDE